MELSINRQTYQLEGLDDELLLWVLRDDLGLTGTKPGCEVGVCGSCTVLIDEQPGLSCQLLARTTSGHEICTIEKLAEQDENGQISLHPVQRAFLDEQASQCGWCVTAQILSAVALLKANPNPTEAEISAAMSKVYCRCGVYNSIKAAVKRAAELVKVENI